jgi:hypothetical protein
MRRLIGFVVMALCAFGQTEERSVPTPPPSYEVRRASGRITVDGRLDEAAWQGAVPMTLLFPWDEQTGAKQKTVVRMLWDDDFLYVAYQCDDTDIVAHHDQHDDPTYEDDAVELLINPDPTHTTYIGLEMNARAVLYDYLFIHPQVLLKAFDLKGVQLASHIDGTLNVTSDIDGGWVLEVAIPMANFLELAGAHPVAAGTVWTANVNRWDGTEPHRRLSMWSDSGLVRPNPHNPKRFGRLVFVR